MEEARLPDGKTFVTFDFNAVPSIRKTHIMAEAALAGVNQDPAPREGLGPPCAVAVGSGTPFESTSRQYERRSGVTSGGRCFRPRLSRIRRKALVER
jgi:hypothetical protein